MSTKTALKDRLKNRTVGLGFMSFDILINKNAGTVLNQGEEQIERQITDVLNGRVRNLHFLMPDEINQYLDRYKNSSNQLLIGGGDGTISAAARQLQPHDKPFGILPLGTMNLLAGDLNISPDFITALTQYWQHERTHIDVGAVNDKIFLCNAVLGVVPEATKVREKARRTRSLTSWSHLITAVMKGFDEKNRKKIVLYWNKRKEQKQANAIIVANNSYVRQPKQAHDRLKRPSLTCGKLSIYTAKPANLFDSARLLFRLTAGDWQRDRAIDAFETETLDIDIKEDKALLTIDGELEEVPTPLHFTVKPKALPLLVPAGI